MVEACELVHFDEPPSIEVMLNEENVKPKLESKEYESSVWYLDNGANNHMTNCKKNFIELDEAIMAR